MDLKSFYENNIGETKNIIFKSIWTDFGKFAKIILGIGNYRGGVSLNKIIESR